MADVQPLGDGWFLVTDGDARWRVAIADGPEGRWVFVNGQVGLIEHERPPSARKRSPHGEAAVMSPMPASVVAINAGAGQAVMEGDTVIVLEAMKMELPIKSPRSGIVKAVHCAKGDLVQPGVVLLEIE